MTLNLDQARKAIMPVRSRTGSKDLEDILRAYIEGDIIPEHKLVDLRARSFIFDDFLAAAIEGRLSSTAGSGAGTAAATTVAAAMNGEVTITSSSANAAHSANASNLTFDQLNWKANQGGCVWEVRLKVDVITNCYMFVGWTDTISTTVEYPCGITGTTANSDASDAAGFVFDSLSTVVKWHLVGVKADTDATPVPSASAPVAATYQTLRIELDKSGGVKGFIDGALVGEIANALTATVGLTPTVVIGNTTATTKIGTLDYVAALQNR